MKLNVDADLPWLSSNDAFPIFADETQENDTESRVFCSTGKGGGKDASCSPKDKGGGGSDIPDVSDLTKVRSLGGSTGATLAADKDGNQYVVKGGNSPDHLRSEFAANQIYEAAGVDVPRVKLDESNPKSPKQVSEYVEAKPLASVRGAERDKAISEIQKGFAADALLANWDVVGLEEDNILVPKSGAPLRVDNGGSLTYRAQGKDKPFGPTVGELDTLRTSQQGKPIFGSLKDDQIASQIDNLSARREKILAATPEPLRDTMSQRLDYMEKWAAGKRQKRALASAAESRVFCPTGEGGGKDASCSPKEAGAAEPGGGLKPPSGKHGVRLPKDPRRMDIDQANAAMKQLGYEVGKYSFSLAAKSTSVSIKDSSGKSATIPVDKLKAIVYGNHKDPAVAKTKIRKRRRSNDAAFDAERRVFCATGPGGGKDASCSPKDAGGGGKDFDKDGVPLKVVGKSSIEVGKSYKITKLQKEYYGKCVSVTHSEDGKKTTLTLKLDPGQKGGGSNKTLTIMSAAKVQERTLAAIASAEKKGVEAWQKDIEKLVKEKEAESKPTPGTKVGGKGSIQVPESTAGLEPGAPDGWGEKPGSDIDEPSEAQKAALASESARTAIRAYTGSAYQALNAALRSGSDAKTPASLKAAASKLTAKLSAAQLGALSVVTEIPGQSEKTVFRGAGGTLAKMIASLPEGGTFIDEGFGSTSSRLGVAQGFASGEVKVVMRIRTRWGVPVKTISGIASEHEHLQPRNMKYKVGARQWRREGFSRVLYVDLDGIGPAKPV